ncbi:MAG: cytosine permease, partial [Myxococcaceae bacterium]
LGPIAGVMIADYWVLRKCQLDVPDLYRTNGRYAGINVVAVVALIIGAGPSVPGFLKSAKVISGPSNLFDALYVYAWFIGFGLAFAIYLLGSKLRAK